MISRDSETGNLRLCCTHVNTEAQCRLDIIVFLIFYCVKCSLRLTILPAKILYNVFINKCRNKLKSKIAGP